MSKGPESHPVRTAEWRVLTGFSIAIALSLLVSVAAFYSISRLESSGDWVAHTNEVIARLQRILSLATDAEAAGRGFVITGDDAYLEPYGQAKSRVFIELEELRRMVADDAKQSQRMAELADLVAARIKRVETMVDIRSHKGLNAARTKMSDGIGRTIQTAIRRVVADMETTEQQLLKMRIVETRRSTWIAKSIVAIGSLLSVLVALAARQLAINEYERNRKSQLALVEANAQLDARVAMRTADLTTALKQLQLSDAAFRSIQESIVITTPDCRVVAVNPAFTRVTEYSEDEVIGTHMRFMQSGKNDPTFYKDMWATLCQTGSWQGEIWNRRKGGEVYLEWLSISSVVDEKGQLTHYIGVAADLSRMNRAQTELERMAHQDPLTGLPNRLMLLTRLEHSLERAKREGTLCAVLFQDLDRFKQVNDSLGHSAGDELLKLVGDRLRNCVREIDTVARLGGDEFVVILEGLCSRDEASVVADDLIKEINMTFVLPGKGEANVGTSIGISVFPGDAQTPQILLEKADEALYVAKSAGGNSWRFAAACSLSAK